LAHCIPLSLSLSLSLSLCREKGKKEYSQDIRELARFARKRDPRVQAHIEHMKQLDQEKQQKQLDAARAAVERNRQEFADMEEEIAQLEEERWAQLERQLEDLGVLDEYLAVDLNEQPKKESHYCVACGSRFKSEKAYVLLVHCHTDTHIKYSHPRTRRAL
jgi:DnaJ homolog subfamily A member 5